MSETYNTEKPKTVLFKNTGDIYQGEYDINDNNDVIVNGYGTYTWVNGDVYEGNFVNNEKHGYGKLIFSNKEQYVGNWLNDLFNDYGVYSYPDGEEYKGYWKDGLMHGECVCFYPYIKITCKCNYINGEESGECVITFTNNTVMKCDDISIVKLILSEMRNRVLTSACV